MKDRVKGQLKTHNSWRILGGCFPFAYMPKGLYIGLYLFQPRLYLLPCKPRSYWPSKESGHH